MEFNQKILSSATIKALEIGRCIFAGLGFYLAYHYYYQNIYQIALSALLLFVVVPLSGLTGLESIFFSKAAAEAKGREIGSSYQIQSGLNNLAIAITALIVWFSRWNIYASLTVLFIMLIFFLLSAINHAVEFIIYGNKKSIHLLRVIFTLIMIGASLPIILKVLE